MDQLISFYQNPLALFLLIVQVMTVIVMVTLNVVPTHQGLSRIRSDCAFLSGLLSIIMALISAIQILIAIPIGARGNIWPICLNACITLVFFFLFHWFRIKDRKLS